MSEIPKTPGAGRRIPTSIQLSTPALLAADRLAKAQGMSRSRLIETLIIEAARRTGS